MNEPLEFQSLDEYRASLRCRRCKVLLSTVCGKTALTNKFCPKCRSHLTKESSKLYKKIKEHPMKKTWTITCSICGKKFSFSGKAPLNLMCPDCRKAFLEQDEKHRKIVKALEGTPYTVQTVRSFTKSFQDSVPTPEEDARLPPHLRGLTARERQKRALAQLERGRSSWLSTREPEKPEPPVRKDISIEKNHPLERFLPQNSMRFKHQQPAVEDPAERHYHTKIDPESGKILEVETRGQSFYSRRS